MNKLKSYCEIRDGKTEILKNLATIKREWSAGAGDSQAKEPEQFLQHMCETELQESKEATG